MEARRIGLRALSRLPRDAEELVLVVPSGQREPPGQHGRRGALHGMSRCDSSLLGCGPRDGAALEGGRRLGRRSRVAQLARGDQMGRAFEYARNRPTRVQLYCELIKRAQATLERPITAAQARMASVGPDGRRAVAGRVPPLSSADRPDRRPDRASSSFMARRSPPHRESRQPVRNLSRREGDVTVAGRASRAGRGCGRGSAPTRRQGDRATGSSAESAVPCAVGFSSSIAS